MKVLFIIYLILGTVKPDGEYEGRKTYTLKTKEATYTHAYKAEIMEYIKTKEFKYNEDLE